MVILYIDPSAVTYVIQAVAGAVIAIGALLAVFRHKIAAFFKRTRRKKPDPRSISMMKRKIRERMRNKNDIVR